MDNGNISKYEEESLNISPDYNRILTTIRHEEPDRVPLAELQIDLPVKEGFLGKPVIDIATDVEFWHKAGYDYIYLRPAYEYEGVDIAVASGTPMAAIASGEKRSSHSVSSMENNAIKQMSDIDTYPWPNPDTIDYSNLTEAAGSLPRGMGIISGVGGIFTRVWQLMGYERFCMAQIEAPELISALFEKVGKIQAQVLQRVIGLDKVFAIWYGDDLAYTESLMASPPFFRKYLFPWIEELASIAHNADMPFIMHSDGKLWDILPDLVTLGLDALQPIEPKAMDIKEVKAKYGDKLALFGNIDLTFPLCTGTPEDVRAEVRWKIKDLASGGGYALGSSCSVARYVPVENYRAMVEAVFEYGSYPINL